MVGAGWWTGSGVHGHRLNRPAVRGIPRKLAGCRRSGHCHDTRVTKRGRSVATGCGLLGPVVACLCTWSIFRTLADLLAAVLAVGPLRQAAGSPGPGEPHGAGPGYNVSGKETAVAHPARPRGHQVACRAGWAATVSRAPALGCELGTRRRRGHGFGMQHRQLCCQGPPESTAMTLLNAHDLCCLRVCVLTIRWSTPSRTPNNCQPVETGS